MNKKAVLLSGQKPKDQKSFLIATVAIQVQLEELPV